MQSYSFCFDCKVIAYVYINFLNELLFWMQLDVIGIDEAQFFEDLYDFCCKAADEDGKVVVVAGLDGDYLRYYLGDNPLRFFY